jgi:hypothetical protein
VAAQGMTVPFPFDGDDTEKYALLNATGRHCTCPTNDDGYAAGTCPAHQLLTERSTVRRLIFERHESARLRREEGLTDGS